MARRRGGRSPESRPESAPLELGPYSVDEAADIAAAAGVPADIMTMIAGSEDPHSIVAALRAGRVQTAA